MKLTATCPVFSGSHLTDDENLFGFIKILRFGFVKDYLAFFAFIVLHVKRKKVSINLRIIILCLVFIEPAHYMKLLFGMFSSHSKRCIGAGISNSAQNGCNSDGNEGNGYDKGLFY